MLSFGLPAVSFSARLNHSLTLFFCSSVSTMVSREDAFISGVISTPAYLSAVTYKGSLTPVILRRSPESSSSGVLSETILPLSIRITLSTGLQRTSSSLCSTIMMVSPVLLWISSISSMAFLPVSGSRFASGSSKSSTPTLSTITPPSDTLCFCPPDSSCGECKRCDPILTTSAISFTLSCSSGSPTASFSSAKARSSATVSPMN